MFEIIVGLSLAISLTWILITTFLFLKPKPEFKDAGIICIENKEEFIMKNNKFDRKIEGSISIGNVYLDETVR